MHNDNQQLRKECDIMSDLVFLSNYKEESQDKQKPEVDKSNEYKLNQKQRKQLQHEFKVYMEKYFKSKLGKGVDYTKVIIWDDMLIIRGEKFLTEPEKYIIQTPSGREVVNSARMQVAKQHSIDNLAYFEERLGAKCIHQTYDIESENDFWIHVMVFDKILVEE